MCLFLNNRVRKMDNVDILYGQMLEALDSVTILIKFEKVNGEKRVMLCTRNKMTIQQLCQKDFSGMLAGMGKRCNIGNHNIPVVDLVLGEARTFSVARLEAYQVLGVITSENAEAAFTYYNEVVDKLEEELKKEMEEKTGKSGKDISLIDLV